jgi:hypothetical protein
MADFDYDSSSPLVSSGKSPIAPPDSKPAPSPSSDPGPKPEIPPAKPGELDQPIDKGKAAGVEKAKALELDSMKMAPPPYRETPPPEPQHSNPMQVWGSAAMVFAMLASMRTKHRATTALNAAAEVMHAAQQGDKEETERRFKYWQETAKQAHEHAVYNNELYKEGFQRAKSLGEIEIKKGEAMDATLRSKMMTVAVAHEDYEMVNAFKADPSGALAAKLQDWREKSARQFDEATKTPVKVREANAVHMMWLNSEEGRNATPAERAEHQIKEMDKVLGSGKGGAHVDPLTPEQENQFSHEVYLGLMKIPPANLKSASWARVLEKAQKEAEANGEVFDAGFFDRKQKALSNWQQGKNNQNVVNVDTAAGHLDELESLGPALAQGNYPAMNNVLNKLGYQGGDSKLSTWDAVKQAVAGEIAKAISGTGSSALKDREDIAAILGAAKNPEQRAEMFKSLKNLFNQRLGAMKQSYTHATKQNDFDEMLRPETLTYLGFGGRPRASIPKAADAAAHYAVRDGKEVGAVKENGVWVYEDTKEPVPIGKK